METTNLKKVSETVSASNVQKRVPLKAQDAFFPSSCVNRLMMTALPSSSQISVDAKQAVRECASEFICFITSEASDRCCREDRKTINGDDVLWAMAYLGFEEYITPLKVYLFKYREQHVGRGSSSSVGRYSRANLPSPSNKDGCEASHPLECHPPYEEGLGYMEPWSGPSTQRGQ